MWQRGGESRREFEDKRGEEAFNEEFDTGVCVEGETECIMLFDGYAKTEEEDILDNTVEVLE